MTLTQRTDAQLKEAVVAEMAWTPSVNSAHIGVAVNRGAVTLSGEVESYPEKYLAEKAALRVRGVNAVAEEITVRSTWAGASDTDIAREANEALDRAVDVPLNTVKASVHNHVITLTGSTPWQFQRAAAGRSVRYLKGVTAVSNNISIQPMVSASSIKSAIAGALLRDAQLAGRGISVSAESSDVTLDGHVHSWAERRLADTAAWSAPGVTGVTNNLRISTS